MTFENLPQNFRDLPLDDPILRADAVDLFVGHFDRVEGCLALVLLDDEHRCVQPVLIGEMGSVDPEELRVPVTMMLEQLRPPAVVAAIGRDGSALFTDRDRSTHQILVDITRDVGVDLLATYVATENAVRELPDHLRMAS
ncbi:hypothetical protein [Knoellia subterranea]|uniref:Uncharacterized protein n=1 Tax=Knoellia subterranea KCTC 19937 TaxID=1385521 RepID=A0A0A0JS26_9MICO|nr:hypothetical protein [Knoellia subterranea]KGN38872.1 hypothetical protein N803_08035 [Knoellia subterranea KCTC 19937]